MHTSMRRLRNKKFRQNNTGDIVIVRKHIAINESPWRRGSMLIQLLRSICVSWGLLLFTVYPGFTAEHLSSSQFDLSVESYRSGDYAQALQLLTSFLLENRESDQHTAAFLLRGQILFDMKNYSASLETLRDFQSRFPNSRLYHHAGYLLGENYYALHQSPEALKEYLSVYISTDVNQLKNKAGQKAVDIFGPDLDKATLARLAETIHNPHAQVILLLKQIVLDVEAHQLESAQQHLRQLPEQDIPSVAMNLYTSLQSFIEKSFADPYYIGAIFSYDDNLEDDRAEFLKGISFAIHQHNEQQNRSVNLLVSNVHDDPIINLQSVRRFANNPNCFGLITSTSEPEALITALEASHFDIPVLLPSTQRNDIAQIGPHIMQRLSSRSFQAKTLAEHAIQDLHLQTFAILAPKTDRGEELANEFMATVDEKGGIISAVEWYVPGTMDFTWQFQNIRRIGMEIMFLDTLQAFADSIDIQELTRIQIDSLRHAYLLQKAEEEIQEATFRREQIDSLDIAIESIDAIYLPISVNDIRYIAPQFANYNINAQVLGSDDWYNEEELQKHRNYINGIIFPSNFLVNEPEFATFQNAYRTVYGETPTRWTVRGYDCANVFLHSLTGAFFGRAQLRNALFNELSNRGIETTVRFDAATQSNISLWLLQYSYGRIEPVKTF